ncbi:MAG: hypothetical protein RLZZ612_2447 [Pseudomonadota bacterium]|jgi:predicted flavoprotein YhiN
MTSKKVFIPTLTDVVTFTDRVPVLTEKADPTMEGPSQQTTVAEQDVDTEEAPHQSPASDLKTLTEDVWKALEPALKQMLQEEVVHLFEQQHVQIMARLGERVRPALAQALVSKLTHVRTDPNQSPRTETSW